MENGFPLISIDIDKHDEHRAIITIFIEGSRYVLNCLRESEDKPWIGQFPKFPGQTI